MLSYVASLTHTFNITWVNSLIINTVLALPWRKIHISVGVVVGGNTLAKRVG